MWVVARNEIHARLHQAGEEVHVSGESVELGGKKSRAAALGVGDCESEPWSVGLSSRWRTSLGADRRSRATARQENHWHGLGS
jgi:hypothetical protein